MLARQASNRNPRANRSSRGRGQDSMSRGASSSSKFADDPSIPKGPSIMRVATDNSQSRTRAVKKQFKKKSHSKAPKTGTPSGPSAPNAFEKERAENAAKRAESKNPRGTMTNGRGGRGGGNGSYPNKPNRCSNTAIKQKSGPSSKPPSPTTTDPFAKVPSTTPTFGSAAPAIFNSFGSRPGSASSTNTPNPKPFGAPSNSETAVNPFDKPALNSNPFGAPSSSEAATNPFGKPSSTAFGAAPTTEAPSNPFNKPTSTSNPFGNPLNNVSMAAGVFDAQQSKPWPNQSSSVFGTQPTPTTFGGSSTNGEKTTPTQSKPSPFGTPASTSSTGIQTKQTGTFGSLRSTGPFGSSKNAFGSSNGTSNSQGSFAKPTTNGAFPKPSYFAGVKPTATSNTPMFSKPPSDFGSPASTKPATNSLAAKVEQQLKKDRIVPPQMPTYDLMFNRQLLSVPELMQHLRDYKNYQEKVRSSLMKAGLIDDPDKPKSLKDAIDFKGTCEDMCPQMEKIERLVEGRVDVSEKGLQADGTPTRHAVMEKMVKILARSSAGQAAPLPSEVRTTAALRRTVDYLMKDVLTEDNISKVHGYLWNRTRAIRRDFVFHSFMTSTELVDQVYCLETIARFHTISLHLMSKPENYSETFDTHQEFEQLGNTMISLMQAYGDCKANGVVCPNEAEFRAYLVVIQRKSNPGLLEMVHSWGWELFEAKEMKIALGMAEALGNNWDMHGPLKPTAPTDVAQNAFSRFFDVVQDQKTSYTMACFAEIWFNDAREAIIRTILASYRKQRNQIKDWTVPVLNEYLRFDDENDVIPWCEARDVVFEETDGLTYLSLEPGNVLSHTEGKQYHSHRYVETKRGSHSLQHVLYNTVYAEASTESPTSMEEEDEGLFVRQSDPIPKPKSITNGFPTAPTISQGFTQTQAFPKSTNPPVQENQPKPTSLLDRIGTPATSKGGFTGFTPVAKSSVLESKPTSILTPQPINGAQSIFTKQPASQESSIFSKPPMNGTISFLPSQPASGTSPFFQKQQMGGEESATPKAGTGPSAILTPSVLQTEQQPGSQAPSFFSFAPIPPAQPAVHSSTTPSTIENVAVPSPAAPKHVSFFPQQQSSTTSPPSVAVPPPAVPAVLPLPPLTQPLSAFFGTPAPANNHNPLNGSSQFQSNTPKESPGVSAFQSSAPVQYKPAFVGEPPPPPVDKFTIFTDWFALGKDGIVEQFASYQVEKILKAAVKQFAQEENVRKVREADDAVRAEADLFRYKTLASKYGILWREQAHLRWLKRRGREARKNRREMAESFRASKVAQSAAVVEDFRATATSQPQGSLASLLGATGVLNGVHDANSEARAIFQEDRRLAHKRQRSERSERSTASQSSTVSKHKRGKSEVPRRQSILSDPSYLQGGSRIHLLSDYNLREEQNRPQVSGVQTDYFRLKARGISTLHDGTPLANSVAQHTLTTKRSFDGFVKPTTPRSRHHSTPRSVPSKRTARSEADGDFSDQVENVEALRARAHALMSGRKNSGQKRSYDDEDEELFARAKRIREQMEEGEDYYRRELERESGSPNTS